LERSRLRQPNHRQRNPPADFLICLWSEPGQPCGCSHASACLWLAVRSLLARSSLALLLAFCSHCANGFSLSASG
jgi:hypothetical protein